MNAAASRSGTWWNWKFWRVVMWPLFSGHVLLDAVGEHLHLLGVDAAEGELHADHLHVGLALAVDALLQAEADELVLLDLAAEVPLGLVVEVVELALEDRDHVPGHVLVDLGVLERAPALRGGADGGRRFHRGSLTHESRPGFRYLTSRGGSPLGCPMSPSTGVPDSSQATIPPARLTASKPDAAKASAAAAERSPDAAVEDDRALLVELARARQKLLERDVRGVARDAARIALLGRAHVDELDVARRLEPLRVYLACHALIVDCPARADDLQRRRAAFRHVLAPAHHLRAPRGRRGPRRRRTSSRTGSRR